MLTECSLCIPANSPVSFIRPLNWSLFYDFTNVASSIKKKKMEELLAKWSRLLICESYIESLLIMKACKTAACFE